MLRICDDICLILLISLCCLSLATESENENEARIKRSGSRNRGSTGAAFDNIDVGHLPIGLQRGLQGVMVNTENLATLTPSPVSPEEAECQVGVKETKYHDGRCIRLGNRQRPACQAGRHLDVYNSECIRQASLGGGRSGSSTGNSGGSSGRRGRGRNQRRRGRGRN